MAERAIETLAIVGASARAAAFSAIRGGFRVVAADLFADADLARQAPASRISRYPADFVQWLPEQHVSGWMYTGALENYPRLVDQMAGVVPLWGNTGRTLRNVRSPIRLAQGLSDAGLSYPEITLSSHGIPPDGTWLRKPIRSSNGAGIEPWTGRSSELSRRSYWQRPVRGTPCAALFVGAAGEARLLGVTRQLVGEAWTGARPFQYAGSIGPWPTTPAQFAQIMRLGETLTCVFPLRGLFGIDLMIDGETVWLIEVNPRYTAAAEVVERFSDVNSVAAHVAACEGKQWVARPESAKGVESTYTTTPTENAERATPKKVLGVSLQDAPSHYGKAILYANTDTAVEQDFFDWAIERSGPSFATELADIPHVGTELRVGHPVLTVLAAGESPDMVEANLKYRMAQVKARLCGS